MKHKKFSHDYQAAHIASEFPTYADWKRFRDFYGGDKKIDFKRYHRAKKFLNNSKKKSAVKAD